MTDTAPVRTRGPRLWWLSLRSAALTVLGLGLLGAAAAFAVLALTGQAIRLPPALVARIEARLDDGLPPRMQVDLGGVEVAVDDDWTPRLRLADVALRQDGAALLTLPEAAVVFDPGAFLTGRLLPVDVRLSGADIALTRDAAGRIDIGPGPGAAGADLAAARAALRRVLAAPALAGLRAVGIDRVTLSLADARSGRVWRATGGRLAVTLTEADVRAELTVAVAGATARLSAVAARGSDAASLRLTVDGVAAADLAAQVAPLAALSVVDAPLSGEVSGSLDAAGAAGPVTARLTLGPGSLRPDPGATPLPFDGAALDLSFDPATARVTLREGRVQSRVLRARLTGHADLLDAGGAPLPLGGWPDQITAQLALSDAAFDPQGLFAAPLTFPQGAVDLRLRLRPFAIDLGQVSLTGDATRLAASGRVTADAAGWTTALDISLSAVATGDLLRLWPLSLVPKTRDWFARNVRAGQLRDLRAAVRLRPGATAVVAMQYDFADATVQVMPNLPPITGGRGRAALEGQAYTIALDDGTVTPPEGGAIDVAGSSFRIADVTARPNVAAVRLVTDSPLTAAMSLLNQAPFRFLQKAGQPVDLGGGRARVIADLTLPLQPAVELADVTYAVTGEVTDFASDRIVPGRRVTAPRLDLTADPAGLMLRGAGRLGDLPFDAAWRQPFGPEGAGGSTLTGSVRLTDAGLRSIGVALPDGLLSGETAAEVTVALPRGAPAELRLTGDLAGAGLRVPALGFAQAGPGALGVEATLSTPPRVDRLTVDLPGLSLAGSVRLQPGGGLEEAAFDRLVAGDWLDATAVVTGAGARVTGGTMDLRRMPGGTAGGGGGAPFGLTLDRLRVSDTIAFTGFRGSFNPQGGLNGKFRAGVNGAGAVDGTVVPIAGGSAVRLRSDDAGSVLAAAGIFASARGGALDLTLIPQGAPGTYDGRAAITGVRVQNANVLAALLNAISVVGLLEQLNGSGIVFNNVDVDFRLTPQAVEITRGAATGASLGVSMAGVYDPAAGRMDVQGVISPIYIVNGIGAIFTRAGEGLFGFTYRMSGPAGSPSITVNPLSILTPGMFREIFRRPAPRIPE